MGSVTDYKYDAFISYSPRDEAWVRHWLLPRLEGRSLSICIEHRDFAPGVLRAVNTIQAIKTSHHTVIVLTQAWLDEDWTKFHLALAQNEDPAARASRILPLLLEHCELPFHLSLLTPLDFTNETLWLTQLERLIDALSHTTSLTTIGDPLVTPVGASSYWSAIREHVQQNKGSDSAQGGGAYAFPHQRVVARLLATVIHEEVREALSQTTIFRKGEYSALLKDVSGLHYYAGIRPEGLVSPEELDISSAASLGLLPVNQRAPKLPEKLCVGLPVTMVGPIALLTLLEKVKGIDLAIDYACCSGTDVLRKVRKGEVNAVVLPIGGASELIRQQSTLKFFPLMLMPGGSYSIIAQPQTKSLMDIDNLAMPISKPSSAVSYCDELKEIGSLSKGVHYDHTEYDETIEVLEGAESATAVAQWFPIYKFSEYLGYRALVKSSPAGRGHYSLSTFLFLRTDLFSNSIIRQWLAASMRDAWLELIENPARLVEIIDIMLYRDAGFLLKAMKRCSGMKDSLFKSVLTRFAKVQPDDEATV